MTLHPDGQQSELRSLADRYALEGQLGAGGMAIVHRARDLRHGCTVAIKMLRPDVAQSLGAERFLRELRLVAQLSHPHILPLFDSGEVRAADGSMSLYYVTNHGERAAWNLACLAAELGMKDEAAAWARAAITQRDPTIYAYGGGA